MKKGKTEDFFENRWKIPDFDGFSSFRKIIKNGFLEHIKVPPRSLKHKFQGFWKILIKTQFLNFFLLGPNIVEIQIFGFSWFWVKINNIFRKRCLSGENFNCIKIIQNTHCYTLDTKILDFSEIDFWDFFWIFRSFLSKNRWSNFLEFHFWSKIMMIRPWKLVPHRKLTQI